MWVYEESINGTPLTELINTKHENSKYFPGIDLPENLVRACTALNFDITKLVVTPLLCSYLSGPCYCVMQRNVCNTAQARSDPAL